MSALAKPLFFFTGAVGADANKAVNADYIYDMSTENTTPSVTDTTVVPCIKIIYLHPANAGVREVTYKFVNATQRDFSFAALKAAVGAQIAAS